MSTPLGTSASDSVDVTSAKDIQRPDFTHNSDASIDNGSGPVYVITGVVIAIIVLGIVTALVAVVLFMKARYTFIIVLNV